ncbi:MAG: PqqD family protein [Eubacteriales bacterium]|nr:PqqD family protein [Eubacteriales bacterium]
MLKTKKGFLLRKLGNEYMVVAIGEASKTFNGMIRMNETGAFYWRELEKGITEEELAAKTAERFENLDESVARRDLREFLETIAIALENDEQHD